MHPKVLIASGAGCVGAFRAARRDDTGVAVPSDAAPWPDARTSFVRGLPVVEHSSKRTRHPALLPLAIGRSVCGVPETSVGGGDAESRGAGRAGATESAREEGLRVGPQSGRVGALHKPVSWVVVRKVVERATHVRELAWN
ncbi:hypothetical protein C8J57DRAFT_1518042 [Mycena rebaudengoi]|nr:hypothetical protein C8J57DRAFT_1518042 [Mycena rebaudengoi]